MAIQSDPQTSQTHASASSISAPTPSDNNIRDTPAPKADEHGYTIREQPMGTKRPIRVILMGCGASSLNFFYQAERHMANLKITCYEKNTDIVRTWLENRYPGCACDIPSVNYQFSWKTKLWTHYYSYAPEIWAYLKAIERENNFISKYVKLRHCVEGAIWDVGKGVWKVTVRDVESDRVIEDEAEFFINAGGVLNNWKWPDVEGLKDFRGKLMHSAAYEEGYELEGKKVAVIGSGSSGVQIVAAIQKKVDRLYHWEWIEFPLEEQLAYLEANPKKYLEYRKQIENELNQRFKFIIKGSPEAQAAHEYAETEMRTKLSNDARLADAIIPKTFNPGCRRPTPAPGYLEALVADNVTIFTEQIDRITETGFVDADGVHHEVDVIICATGFDTSWLPRYPFSNGTQDLKELWSAEKGVMSYLSVGIPTFPNHFSFCGPYGPLGHGSFMPLIEIWTRYIFALLTKAQVENIKSFAPALSRSRMFRQHADLFLQRTAWTSPCRSWFKQGRTDGQAAIWPGSRLHFLEMMKTPRYEDYEMQYWDENVFAFMGNGFEMREFDGRDVTDYLGCLDGEGRDVQPVYDRGLIDVLGGMTLGEEYVVTDPDEEGKRAREVL